MSDAFRVKRVVVALESACENLAALERAAQLAQRTRAELHAVFLEDPRLFEAAALPFTRYVCLASGTGIPLESGKIEDDLRAMAQRSRRRLDDLARRFDISCSFESVRGDRSAAIDATGCDDLLVVETATRGIGRFLARPSDWSNAVAACGRSCLMLPASGDTRRNVLVLQDGSPADARALAAARALQGGAHARLIVAATPEVASAAPGVLPLMAVSSEALRRAVAHESCGLIVAPAALFAAQQAALAGFLAAPACALLLVA